MVYYVLRVQFSLVDLISLRFLLCEACLPQNISPTKHHVLPPFYLPNNCPCFICQISSPVDVTMQVLVILQVLRCGTKQGLCCSFVTLLYHDCCLNSSIKNKFCILLLIKIMVAPSGQSGWASTCQVLYKQSPCPREHLDMFLKLIHVLCNKVVQSMFLLYSLFHFLSVVTTEAPASLVFLYIR